MHYVDSGQDFPAMTPESGENTWKSFNLKINASMQHLIMDDNEQWLAGKSVDLNILTFHVRNIIVHNLKILNILLLECSCFTITKYCLYKKW